MRSFSIKQLVEAYLIQQQEARSLMQAGKVVEGSQCQAKVEAIREELERRTFQTSDLYS